MPTLPARAIRILTPSGIAFLSGMIALGLLVAIPACTKRTDRDTTGQEDASRTELDSMRKKPIEAMVTAIDSGVVRQPKPILIPYPKYSQEDSIKIWMPTPGDARISLFMHQPRHLVWPTLHVHQGELIQVRYREHRMFQMDTSAAEVMIYLDDDKILYAEERVKVLEHMEIPGVLRTMPFVPSKRTEESLRALYAPYWADIQQSMAANGLFLTGRDQGKKQR